ncbi:caspase family protein [Leptolyngbya iicbica]|uniref:Peptidase C14 caspase domain-containing protein n=2 Tax=Cyanophyceae TaxID=3028117 RepID=A0A4Q7E8Y4_9CYAN|nr:caspase family protein [Leptolyngbya sp. LK]RZM79287.1 hypothetical protein DYY88_11090 [Leptolyngbya sp. LK]
MANQWALLIGINQYKALQPLMYAQPDAVGLRNFLVDELGVPVNHCTLLTDVSAAIEPHAYMPLRQEIEHQLETLCRDQVQPGDLLWVFFSGCGLTEAGQDYWMTLDAEPTNLSETAIPVSQIFKILSQAQTDQIVLAMDMNRSQGAVGHRDIGTQTLTLAKDYGITTFLSCQPEQFSHETMYVKHGLFTKAMLEGLRYHGCVTASQLGEYLASRVPELCEHHCRPPQNPVMVVPQTQKFMMVVPADGLANLSPTENLTAIDEATLATVPANNNVPPVSPVSPAYASEDTSPADDEPLPLQSQPSPEPSPSSIERVTAVQDDSSDTASGMSGLWKWGALAAAIAFLAGVFFRFQPILFGEGEQTASDTPADVVGDDPEGAGGPDGEAVPEDGTAPADAPPAAENDAAAPTEAPPEQEDPIERGNTALQRAEEALEAQRYGEARAWLEQVPPEVQNNRYQDLLQSANSEVAEAAVRNQTILSNARQVLQPTSASMFNDAIEQARQVPPEDPYYEQAQADIKRWGRVILDLAEGRAASGNIVGAIAAARLVPEDQPELTTLAAQRIQSWEQQIANQELIQQTQNSLQPGQASSYNDAVRTLEQIEPGQPGYEDARARMQQWGQDILAIARARAAQGDLGGAIGAARLVPESTDAYAAAQEEIQRWQAQ